MVVSSVAARMPHGGEQAVELLFPFAFAGHLAGYYARALQFQGQD